MDSGSGAAGSVPEPETLSETVEPDKQHQHEEQPQLDDDDEQHQQQQQHSQEHQQGQEEGVRAQEVSDKPAYMYKRATRGMRWGRLRQIRTLVWKHFLEEYRQPVKLLSQCCIPIAVICVLVFAHAVTNKSRSYSHCFFQPKALPTSGVLSFFQTKLCDWNSTCLGKDQPVRGSNLRGFHTPESILQLIRYANDNQRFDAMVLDMVRRLTSPPLPSIADLLAIAANYSDVTTEPEFQRRLFGLTTSLTSDAWSLANNDIFTFEYDSAGITKVHIALYNLSVGVCGRESTDGNFGQIMEEAGIDRGEFLRDRKDVVTLDFTSTRGGNATRRRRRRSLVERDDGAAIFWQFRKYYDCHRIKDFSLWKTPLYEFWRLYSEHYYGYILYAPNTTTVNKIVDKARTVFESVRQVQDFIRDWNTTHRTRVQRFLEAFLSQETTARSMCLTIFHDASLCSSISLSHWQQAVKILDLLLPEVDTFFSCFFDKLKDPFVGFSNMSVLWQNLPRYTNGKMKAVLEFHVSPDESELRDKPGFIKYTLHPKAWFTDHPDNLRQLKEPNNPGPRRHWTEAKFLVYSYADNQDIVEWAITEVMSGRAIHDGVYMQMQPYMCWLHDEFFKTFRNFLHFFLIISWVVLVGVIVQKIVYEKETRLKEMILVMGVSREIVWLAWFLSSLAIFMVPTVAVSIILRVTICRLVSFSVVLFTLFTYSVLSIVSAFFLSALFSRANIGATLSCFLYLLTYIPYAICKLVLNMQFHPAGHFILSLLPNVAFAYTFDGILKFEHFSVPVYWSTLRQSPYVLRNFTLAGALAMMWLDALLLLVATAYVEQIHSGTLGTSKSWYFLCSARFWKYLIRQYFHAASPSQQKQQQRQQQQQEPPQQPPPPPQQQQPGSRYLASADESDDRQHERQQPGSQAGGDKSVPIVIHSLCKAYGRNCVLKDFNLNLHENQLTSLVGKNGCGKSTLMSILCGLDTAGSGHVTMFGHSHPEEIGSIREWIGVCPQFDTVFGFLTVKEHVDFYGSLKGLSSEERSGEVAEIVHLLSLPEGTRVNQLSGGQRRKLSLLLAFLGEVKFVILDEPTAGVDPTSRHAIWSLIERLKVGKTILMTSHHLDEAEALADRIAVLGSGGKIHFHDTPGRLKRIYSDCQMLTVSFTQGADCQSYANQLSELVNACAAQGLREAGLARLEWQKRGNDLYFRIPNGVAEQSMAQVLKCIETEKARYQILRFQISQPSMEDIFFLITTGEGDETEAGEHIPRTDGNDGVETVSQGVSRRQENSLGAIAVDSDHAFIRTDFTNELIGPDEIFELADAGSSFHTGGSTRSLVDTEASSGRPQISKFALYKCQVEALLLKRLKYLIRTPSCLVTNICLPILFLAIAIVIIQLRPGWKDSPPVEIHPWHLKEDYPNQGDTLHYFYDFPDAATSNIQPPVAQLYAEQLDRGFQGCRCMNASVYSVRGYDCGVSLTQLNDTNRLDQSCNACSFYCSPVAFPHQSRRLPVWDIGHRLPRNGSAVFNISDWLIQTSNDYLLNRFGGASFGEVNPLTDALARGRDAYDSTVLRLNNTRLRRVLQSVNLTSVVHFANAFYGRRWSSKVWFDNIGYIASPAYLNVFNNARLRALLRDLQVLPTSGIAANLESLPPDAQGLRLDFDNYGYMMALVGILIALSLSAFPCSAICLLVEERSSGALHLQKLFTIPLWLYWLVNFVWDLAIYTCIATVVTVTLHLGGGSAFRNSQDALSVAIVCWSYGLAALPMNYLLSLFFSEQSRAYISLFGLNLLLSILTCLLYSIVYVLQQYNVALRSLLPTLQQALLIACPQFGIAEGIYTVQTNYFLGKVLEEWYGLTGVYKNLLSYDGLLKNASCFAGHCVFFWLLVVFTEIVVHRIGTVQSCNVCVDEDEDEAPAASAGRNNIEVLEVSKRYQQNSCRKRSGRLAVDNVSFSVASGEVLGLLGSNGAGKSSIFRMLTRCESITSGRIRVNGRLNNSFDCFSDAGYCSQSNVLWKTMTPADHLAFYARCKGFRGRALDHEVKALVQQLGLAENAAKPSSHLSGGNKRRLCVAIAFIGSPDVVLLDEPTAGVDVVARRLIWQCIQRARRMQQSILLTSHSMEECELLCDRILIMKAGRVLAQGSVDELVRQFCQGYVLRLVLQADQSTVLCQLVLSSLAESLGLDGSCVFKTDEREDTEEVQILLKGSSCSNSSSCDNGGAPPFVQVYDAMRKVQCEHRGLVSFALVHPSVEEVFHRVMSLADEANGEENLAHQSDEPEDSLEQPYEVTV